MSVMPEPNERWHLDKRVPIALIITIVIQSAAAVWWAASVNASINRLNEKAATFEQFTSAGDRFTQQDARARINPIENDLGVIKNDIKHIRTMLEEIRRN